MRIEPKSPTRMDVVTVTYLCQNYVTVVSKLHYQRQLVLKVQVIFDFKVEICLFRLLFKSGINSAIPNSAF